MAKNDIMTNYSYNSEATSPQEHLTSNFHLLPLDNSAGWKNHRVFHFKEVPSSASPANLPPECLVWEDVGIRRDGLSWGLFKVFRTNTRKLYEEKKNCTMYPYKLFWGWRNLLAAGSHYLAFLKESVFYLVLPQGHWKSESQRTHPNRISSILELCGPGRLVSESVNPALCTLCSQWEGQAFQWEGRHPGSLCRGGFSHNKNGD